MPAPRVDAWGGGGRTVRRLGVVLRRWRPSTPTCLPTFAFLPTVTNRQCLPSGQQILVPATTHIYFRLCLGGGMPAFLCGGRASSLMPIEPVSAGGAGGIHSLQARLSVQWWGGGCAPVARVSLACGRWRLPTSTMTTPHATRRRVGGQPARWRAARCRCAVCSHWWNVPRPASPRCSTLQLPTFSFLNVSSFSILSVLCARNIRLCFLVLRDLPQTTTYTRHHLPRHTHQHHLCLTCPPCHSQEIEANPSGGGSKRQERTGGGRRQVADRQEQAWAAL